MPLSPQGLGEWLSDQPDALTAWVSETGFSGSLGAFCVLPSAGETVLLGLGDATDRARQRFGAVAQIDRLPAGDYLLDSTVDPATAYEIALGWRLAAYRFDRYKDAKPLQASLQVRPEGSKRLAALVAGETLTRDLINMPASDMGPAELAQAAIDLADAWDMHAALIVGSELLEQNFPMIHAVGRASEREPRLIDLRWGNQGPKVTLVGKGVCFDTGGLNIKPSSSMGLMKKDMGGAAHVLGVARMIMELALPVQLRVLIPAVENAISGNAMRPQDVLTSRKGLTVEINNTDAEGRLVLADALAFADEEEPDLLVCMATLTGAARVAVGPDVAPFFTDDDLLAGALASGGAREFD
ncbi:MAG: leucyl aminopeptidase family protein, partial [Pseudomonadota bacterium]